VLGISRKIPSTIAYQVTRPIAEWKGSAPPAPGYVVKLTDVSDLEPDEIKAATACERFVAAGMVDGGEFQGYHGVIMHRGIGAPVGMHPDYLDETKREAFLKGLLESAVDVVEHFATSYEWLHK